MEIHRMSHTELAHSHFWVGTLLFFFLRHIQFNLNTHVYKNSLVTSVVCRHGHKRIEAVWSSTKCCSTPTRRKERPGILHLQLT